VISLHYLFIRFVFKVGCELAAACQPFGELYYLSSDFQGYHLKSLKQPPPTSLIAQFPSRNLSLPPKPPKPAFFTTSRRPRRTPFLVKTNPSIPGAASTLTTPFSLVFVRRSSLTLPHQRVYRPLCPHPHLQAGCTFARVVATLRRCAFLPIASHSKPERRLSSPLLVASAQHPIAYALVLRQEQRQCHAKPLVRSPCDRCKRIANSHNNQHCSCSRTQTNLSAQKRHLASLGP
jgi:hypothetical protein